MLDPLARTGQGRGDRLGGVGEVDEHPRGTLAQGDSFHPSGNLGILQTIDDLVETQSAGLKHGQGHDGVAYVVLTRDAKPHGPHSRGGANLHPGAELRVRGPRDHLVVGLRRHRCADDPHPVLRAPTSQLLATGVVDVDDGGTGQLRGEESGLGLEVVVEGLVEVEVVAPQIREGGDVEDRRVHPVQGQGVRGDLHDDVGGTPVGHDTQQGLQVGRLGRGDGGATAGQLGPVDPVPDGADRAGMTPCRAQPGLHEEGRRRLAIGASDPEHRHGSGGITEDTSGCCRHRRARIVDDDHGEITTAGTGSACTVGALVIAVCPLTRHEADSLGIGEDGNRPGPSCLVGESSSV